MDLHSLKKTEMLTSSSTNMISEMKDDYKRNWKPLMKIMAALGLNMETKERNMYNIIITMFLNILSLIIVCDSISDATQENDTTLKMNYVILILEVMIGLFCFYHCNRYKNQIHEKMMKIYNMSEVQKIKICQRYSILINILFSCLVGIGSIVFDYFESLNKQYDSPVFVGVSVSNEFKKIAKISIKALSEVFIFVPQSFMILLFVVICREMKESFDRLNNKIELETIPRNVLNIVIEKYIYLDRVVWFFEDLFAPVILFWTIRIAIKIGVSVNFILSNITSLSLLDCAHILMWCGWPIILFSDACLSASRVTDSAIGFLTILYNKSLSFNKDCMKDTAFQFSMKCTLEPPVFTGWRMFDVDRGLLLTIASVTLTYLIVMYQLK